MPGIIGMSAGMGGMRCPPAGPAFPAGIPGIPAMPAIPPRDVSGGVACARTVAGRVNPARAAMTIARPHAVVTRPPGPVSPLRVPAIVQDVAPVPLHPGTWRHAFEQDRARPMRRRRGGGARLLRGHDHDELVPVDFTGARPIGRHRPEPPRHTEVGDGCPRDVRRRAVVNVRIGRQPGHVQVHVVPEMAIGGQGHAERRLRACQQRDTRGATRITRWFERDAVDGGARHPAIVRAGAGHRDSDNDRRPSGDQEVCPQGRPPAALAGTCCSASRTPSFRYWSKYACMSPSIVRIFAALRM